MKIYEFACFFLEVKYLNFPLKLLVFNDRLWNQVRTFFLENSRILADDLNQVCDTFSIQSDLFQQSKTHLEPQMLLDLLKLNIY